MRNQTIIGILFLTMAPFCHQAAYGMDITFENVPLPNCYQYGDTNLGDFYASSGVHFGPGVTILDRARGGYNTQDYPARSGSAVAFSASLVDIVITFDSPSDKVNFWYSARNGTLVDAHLKNGTTDHLYFKPELGYTGQAVIPDSMVVSLTIHQVPSFFTMDNLGFEAVSNVPEPSIAAALPGILLMGLGIIRIRSRRRSG